MPLNRHGHVLSPRAMPPGRSPGDGAETVPTPAVDQESENMPAEIVPVPEVTLQAMPEATAAAAPLLPHHTDTPAKPESSPSAFPGRLVQAIKQTALESSVRGQPARIRRPPRVKSTRKCSLRMEARHNRLSPTLAADGSFAGIELRRRLLQHHGQFDSGRAAAAGTDRGARSIRGFRSTSRCFASRPRPATWSDRATCWAFRSRTSSATATSWRGLHAAAAGRFARVSAGSRISGDDQR